jgi:hypothetical protein
MLLESLTYHRIPNFCLLQHLPEVRRRRGVHQSRVPFHPHGLDHAQRHEWIDETRGNINRERLGLGEF